MQTFEQRLKATQAELISELTEQVRHQKECILRLNDEIHRLKPAAEYYLLLQKAILENPILMEEWQVFITVAQMSAQLPIRGLTEPD